MSAGVRVAVAGGDGLGGRREGVGRLNVFRRALVSWYGPGFYGGHLACGGTLTPGKLGVANKTLPCGTMVTLRHGRRTVRVPVIDRGPYVGGREFDLTSATKNRLGFSGVGTVLVTR
jgi:rare lipoprotein A